MGARGISHDMSPKDTMMCRVHGIATRCGRWCLFRQTSTAQNACIMIGYESRLLSGSETKDSYSYGLFGAINSLGEAAKTKSCVENIKTFEGRKHAYEAWSEKVKIPTIDLYDPSVSDTVHVQERPSGITATLHPGLGAKQMEHHLVGIRTALDPWQSSTSPHPWYCSRRLALPLTTTAVHPTPAA